MPWVFRHAVAALQSPAARAEIELDEIRPPARLAPWSYAVAAETLGPCGEAVSARLVLLHDPDGHPAWEGVFRLVGYLSADVDATTAEDPLIPEVGWSWLTDALASNEAGHRALGGTVTVTSSTAFGDMAGSGRRHQLELRGSWTPSDESLEPHARAFYELIGSAAGLPPVGVAMLGSRGSGRRRGQ